MAEYRVSLTTAEKALALDPKDLACLSQVLSSEQSIAKLLAATGDRTGAIDYAQRSIDRAERSGGDNISPVLKMLLARAYNTMAKIQVQFENWSDALAAGTRAVQEWRYVIGNKKENIHAEDLARAEEVVAECEKHSH
jgi:tetratricopeptide (TPR) repeat protein